MSHYQFAPSPTMGTSEHDFVTWDEGFSHEEIQKIIELGDAIGLQDASVNDYRASQISWIGNTPETAWLYDKLAWITRQLNGQFYQFDLSGFYEDFQYTVYQSETQGFYDWHLDRGPTETGSPPRKLSLVVQLSDPYEYEGGELQILTSNQARSLVKKRGLIVAFPSFMLHRVTPVTSGIRRSLVVWATGPAFK